MFQDYISIALKRDELNRYFGGGLPRNSLVLVEGEDGAGKSILCQRFTYAILKNNKFKMTYLSTELNTLDFIKQHESLRYGIRPFILDGSLLFITMVPFLGKVKFGDDFIEKIMTEKKLFESDVIIFDTLSFLLVRKGAEEKEYYDIVNFFKGLNNLNKTIIFTIDPTHLDEKFLTLMRSVADLYIKVAISNFAGESVRVLDIKRFKRPFDVYMPKIPFRVEPREGLVIEIGGYS